ncbi:hypothetical protein [Haloferax volcanii]|uniref:hypothetical protein n=1 Tax=Haloferax volcanii TaxID=2246 RepID=UPI00249C3831|nr:hypothetical protein [Haloferax alexandrinus]
MSGTKFYFATFEVEGNFGFDYPADMEYDRKVRESLTDFVELEGAVAQGDSEEWYFGRPEFDANMIYGKFGKVYADEPLTYDDEIGDFVEGDEPNKEADYSLFAIDLENSLIIFSSTYRVRHRNFTKYLKKGYDSFTGGDASIHLELVRNKEGVETVIQNYPVHKIHAELVPSNPSPDEEWEELDESLREMLADKLGITAEQYNDGGLDFSESFLSQVASMSQSKYGESWEITYSDDDGEFKVISSDDDPASKVIDEEPTTTGGLKAHIEGILSYGLTFLD